jgi:hypothetical protein
MIADRHRHTITVLVALLAVVLGSAQSTAAPGARELLDEAAQRNGLTTWRDRTLELVIESRSGDSVTRVREAQVSESRDADGGHRTFIEFTAPADVQGTLYLHLAPRDGEEQEWLYAPQARRARRITPGQSDETSTGAELGYRAVAAVARTLSWRDGDAEATLVGDETLDGRTCRVVRLVPRAPEAGDAGYDVWLGSDDLLVHKLVPRGGGDGPTPKEILLSSYETLDGHATPRVVEVVGADDSWRTVFRLGDVRYDVGLADGTFSLSRLNRGR